MASFPGAIANLRALVNRAGSVYDALKTKVFYAEDHNLLIDEVEAIENTLGINPDGAYTTVALRLAGIESDVAGKADPLGYTPENVANKDTGTSLGTSDTDYPSQNAVKVYTDTLIATLTALLEQVRITYRYVIDLMEYSSDANAAAAYLRDQVVEQTSITAVDGLIGDNGNNEYRNAQSFTLDQTTNINDVSWYCDHIDGTPSGSLTLRIETNSAGVPSGTLAHANGTVATTPATGWNKASYTPFSLAAGTYWLVFACAAQATNVAWWYSRAGNVYAGGTNKYSLNGGAYVETNTDIAFKINTADLTVTTEGTIKTEGTYALKVVALITSSLNKYLTKTFSINKNLSGKGYIRFSMRASRTGSNIKIGFHDVGGTTTEVTPNIAVANTWQTVMLDISAVTDANKDAIDKIYVTVVNADAGNTFYLDDIGS